MVKANDRRRSAESLALPQWGVAATRAVAAVAMIAAVSLAAADVARGFQPSVAAEQSGVPLKAIHISYKLDSRLTGSTYGGERWVSPHTFVGASGQTTVDVRVAGIDASDTPVDVAPAWSVSNADMMSVSPARGERVTITVNRPGDGLVRAVAPGVVQELAITATSRNDILQIEITSLDAKIAPAPPASASAEVPPAKVLSPAELAEKNTREGEAFLAANGKKPGVVTLKSGLQYQVLKTGNGPKPTSASTVACEYQATTIDGAAVSRTARDKPIAFTLNAAIAGWREALQLMPAGSEWRLFVPPSLAYGETGNPRGHVGPNATLVFDLTLKSIADAPARQNAIAPAAQAAQTASTKSVRRRRR